ncbi:MAG: biotin synthase BioB [Rikenellaceae bacterium]|nr:biotin synthase BioB [Rikenellaceae bacterium]
MKFISELENSVLNGGSITFEEAVQLAESKEKEYLYAAADRIRHHFHDNRMDLCTIVNARSGKCSEDCKWCSQSAHHSSDIDIYDLIERKIALDQAQINRNAGVKKFSLVTSGRTISDKNLNNLCEIYSTLDKRGSHELCASMGLLNKEQLQKLYDSGVRNYHCNIETAPSYFPNVCTTHTVEEKVKTIEWAKEVGMKICSGGIIGMGETMHQRIEMAVKLRELEVDSIPINILNPIKGTKLENAEPLTDEEILTTIALFRFINPHALIRFAGGRTKMLHIQDAALRAGINGALVGDLLTTVGVGMEEDIAHFREMGFEC